MWPFFLRHGRPSYEPFPAMKAARDLLGFAAGCVVSITNLGCWWGWRRRRRGGDEAKWQRAGVCRVEQVGEWMEAGEDRLVC